MYSIKLGCEKVFWGKNAVQQLKTLEGPRKRAFIVMSGNVLIDVGSYKKVTDVLEEAGFEYEAYTEVEPEPSFQTILKGAERMKTFKPDWIIGFGGGSAMDAAKAMWVFYENPSVSDTGRDNASEYHREFKSESKSLLYCYVCRNRKRGNPRSFN